VSDLIEKLASELLVPNWRKRKTMAELDVKQRQAGDVTILDMSGEVRMAKAVSRCVMQSETWPTQATRRSC